MWVPARGMAVGLGTTKESKEFAGINKANTFSSFACVLLCFPTPFTHAGTYVRWLVLLRK